MDNTQYQKAYQRIETIISRSTSRKRFGIITIMIWIVLSVRGYFFSQNIFHSLQTPENYQKIEQGLLSIQSQLSGTLPPDYTLTITNTGLDSSHNPIALTLPSSFGQKYSGNDLPKNFLVINTSLINTTSGENSSSGNNGARANDTSILITHDELLFHPAFITPSEGYPSKRQFSSIQQPLTVNRQEIISTLEMITTAIQTSYRRAVDNTSTIQGWRVFLAGIIALGYGLIIILMLRGVKIIVSVILSLTNFPINSSIPRDQFLHAVIFLSYIPVFILMRLVAIGMGHQGGILIMLVAIILSIHTMLAKHGTKE